MNESAAATISSVPLQANVAEYGEPRARGLRVAIAHRTEVVRTDSASSDLAHALRLLGRGRPSRPRAGRRARYPSENAMQLPKVVEIKRGSAHGAPVVPLTAADASNSSQI
jgi:hypothetical protein